MELPELHSAEDLAALVEEIGFLPFFKNGIEGFSVQEHTPPELWFSDLEGPWEWKGPVIQTARCAYGKFYKGKAVYISGKYFPDFANIRRDGYDYDARMDEGLARARDVGVMQALWKEPSLVSKTLKSRVCFSEEGRRAFDGVMTHLQMGCYVVIEDFVYPTDKRGKPYGWGLARYTTPEAFFGEAFTDRVYRNKPEASYELIFGFLQRMHPRATQKQLENFILG